MYNLIHTMLTFEISFPLWHTVDLSPFQCRFHFFKYNTPYSIVTIPPNALMVSIIFSDSSFGTPSFICFGALSTNFLLSTKLNPSRLLISLMILGLAAASKDLSVSVNKVFSWAAGAGSSSSTTAGAAAGAAAAAKPPTGKSGMFRRVYMKILNQTQLTTQMWKDWHIL